MAIETEDMKDQDSITAGVKQVIQELTDANGEAKPSQLVEAARPASSPAHRGFEWNNKRAGEQYRLWQARQWVRRIVVKTETAPEGERLVHIPHIVRETDVSDNEMPSLKEGTYVPMSTLIRRPDEFARALNEALTRLRAARRALDDLYAAADHTGRTDGAAQVAQMAKATELFAEALSAMH
jgi:hypothetical protein